jgi:two-component system response regulator FlrC
VATVASPATAAASPVRTLAELERDAIVQALEQHEGNRRRAAEQLGIGVRTLYDKLKRYDLH